MCCSWTLGVQDSFRLNARMSMKRRGNYFGQIGDEDLRRHYGECRISPRILHSSFVLITYSVALIGTSGYYQSGQGLHVVQCETKLHTALVSVPLIAVRPVLRNAARARGVVKGLFKCNQCRAEFTENANLSRHRRTMHAAVPSVFVCHICTRTFNRSDNMHMHIKNVHGGGSAVASKWGVLLLQTCQHGSLVLLVLFVVWTCTCDD